jgi:predicted Zn-dependent peptidase
MGVLLGAGSRDETPETSGSMLALKNTFMKTNTRTNEQINYCMVQMAGGELSMKYDQETNYIKGHCLSHDVYDYAQMFSDMVLDEKTVMDEEASQWRADEFFKLRDENITNQRRIEELWLQVAYGQIGLGNPLPGLQSKF